MTLFRKQEPGAKAKPVDDILEGVDIIGTMLDESLPRIEKRLEELSLKVDLLVKKLGDGINNEDDESLSALDHLADQTAMLEEHLLSSEQANVNRFAGLSGELEELSASLQALHEKLDSLLEKENADFPEKG